MPIDKTLILKKLDFLDQHLSAIERMEFDEQSFIRQEDIHDLVTFRLQQAVETGIDIAAHIIAGADFFDYSLLFSDYKENVKDLRQFGSEILKFLEKTLTGSGAVNS